MRQLQKRHADCDKNFEQKKCKILTYIKKSEKKENTLKMKKFFKSNNERNLKIMAKKASQGQTKTFFNK